MPQGVWSIVVFRAHHHSDASPSLLVEGARALVPMPGPRHDHPEWQISSHAAPEQRRLAGCSEQSSSLQRASFSPCWRPCIFLCGHTGVLQTSRWHALCPLGGLWVHLPDSAGHQWVLAASSMLSRQISSHVRRRLTEYHTLRWHETLEEHMSSLDQGRKLFHGLQFSGSSCLSQRLPRVRLQLVVSGLPSLLGPRRQCLLFEHVSGGGHVVQHVLHVASCECRPLLGCMVRVSWRALAVEHRSPAPHQWPPVPCLLLERTLQAWWRGSWRAPLCCYQLAGNVANFLAWLPSRQHADVLPFHAVQGICSVAVPDKIQTWYMLELSYNVWDEHLLCIFLERLGSTRLQHLYDYRSIEDNSSDSRRLRLRFSMAFQAHQQVTLAP